MAQSIGIADDVFAVLPEPFEIEEIAGFVIEDVDDYVGIVYDGPPALPYAFVAAGDFAVLFFELFFQIFGKRFYLGCRSAAAHDKVIAERSFGGDVDIYDVARLFR